eukprot:GHVU01041672.1.p1 GENE.GHVU01041672.1~~GHVU01041672.1.p1  ORF type:complete len:107 (-),score=0.81 GHVU01041672.1:454-774(-)
MCTQHELITLSYLYSHFFPVIRSFGEAPAFNYSSQPAHSANTHKQFTVGLPSTLFTTAIFSLVIRRSPLKCLLLFLFLNWNFQPGSTSPGELPLGWPLCRTLLSST